MDDFRKKQQQRCGVGGLHCYCCNEYEGKDKPKLNKLARTSLQRDLRNEVEHALIYLDETALDWYYEEFYNPADYWISGEMDSEEFNF